MWNESAEYFAIFDKIQTNGETPVYAEYIEFQDANGQILYEFTAFGSVWMGCLKYYYLELYKDKLCQRTVAFDYPICQAVNVNTSSFDVMRVVYNESGNVSYLGMFKLPIQYNYSVYSDTVCWTCDSGLFNDSYDSLGGSCE